MRGHATFAPVHAQWFDYTRDSMSVLFTHRFTSLHQTAHYGRGGYTVLIDAAEDAPNSTVTVAQLKALRSAQWIDQARMHCRVAACNMQQVACTQHATGGMHATCNRWHACNI